MSRDMARRWRLAWSWLVRLGTDWLPDSAATMRLRGWLYGRAMRQCGPNFQVAGGVRLLGLEHLSVGRDVYLAPGVALLASCGIQLDDEVMLAYHTVVVDGNHTRLEGSFRFGPRAEAPVRIGRGAWVAANCTVLPGVTIGRGALVAANSAVTRDVPDGASVGGAPARPLARAAA
jgi:maltose O-acetyltransferase